VGVNGSADSDSLTLRALLFSIDDGQCLKGELAGKLPVDASSRERIEQAATQLGEKLGRLMLDRGAGELIGRG
jgi:hypothetical protein